MKNIGIWMDTSQAIVVKLSNSNHSLKIIESNIDTRERVAGETKKFGRFGGQYLTYEKNRQNKKSEQTSSFFKLLLKEIQTYDNLVLFGPSNMKRVFGKEILKNMQFAKKLKGVYTEDSMTNNQVVAWVKNYFKSNN